MVSDCALTGPQRPFPKLGLTALNCDSLQVDSNHDGKIDEVKSALENHEPYVIYHEQLRPGDHSHRPLFGGTEIGSSRQARNDDRKPFLRLLRITNY